LAAAQGTVRDFCGRSGAWQYWWRSRSIGMALSGARARGKRGWVACDSFFFPVPSQLFETFASQTPRPAPLATLRPVSQAKADGPGTCSRPLGPRGTALSPDPNDEVGRKRPAFDCESGRRWSLSRRRCGRPGRTMAPPRPASGQTRCLWGRRRRRRCRRPGDPSMAAPAPSRLRRRRPRPLADCHEGGAAQAWLFARAKL